MTRTKDTTVVSVLHPVCCGLDIHKQFVTACLMTIDSMGKETSLLESFGTLPMIWFGSGSGCLSMSVPLLLWRARDVRRPVHNLLEGCLPWFWSMLAISRIYRVTSPNKRRRRSYCADSCVINLVPNT